MVGGVQKRVAPVISRFEHRRRPSRFSGQAGSLAAEAASCASPRVADGQHLPEMPIVVVPVKISPPHPCVELKVVGAVRCAAILDARAANALENTVELLVADMEAVGFTLDSRWKYSCL